MKKFLTLIMVCLISASVNFVYAKQSTDQENLNTQLLEASKKGNLEEVKKLIAQGADPNYQDENGRNGLMHVVLVPFAHYPIEETKQIIKILTTAGVDVNKTDKEGNTALMLVVSEFSYSDGADDARVALINILISAGANVNAVNKKGKNALMFIALNGWLDYNRIATKLLNMGANINARNKFNQFSTEFHI